MAERRMFTDRITESDAFLDMPMTSQCLYFHLCMNADDDGFVKNPKRIQKMLGASEDDAKLLVAKAFVLPFESGVIVIKHWRMHNLLRKDRYKSTEYLEEKAMLYLKENGAYTFDENQGKPLLEISKLDIQDESGNQMATNRQPNGNLLAPQDRLGKVNKKENTPCGGTKEKATRFSPPTLEDVQKYCQERKNNVDATRFWNFYESKGWLVGKNKMKDWKAAVRTWEQEDKQKSTVSKPQRQSDHTERVYSADELNSIVKSIGTLSEEDL